MHNLASNNRDIWEEIKACIKPHIGGATFNSWIQPLSLVSYQDAVLKLSAPTEFMASWIEGHYLAKIKDVSPEPLANVEIIVDSEAFSKRPAPRKEFAEHSTSNIAKLENFQNSISSPIDERMSFESFIVSPSNELAFAAAKRIAEMGADAGFNPLFLHSGVGLGKTHLLNAVGNFYKSQKPEQKIMYLSAEKFLHQFVRSIQNKNMLEFKEELRSAEILLIDDFQFICGKASTQEEFFHTLSWFVENKKQIVISCDRCPTAFEDLNERMRSRLSSGLVINIDKADYDLRLAILKSKLAGKNIEIEDEVLEFLAEKIHSNVRELEGALNRIIARASLVGGQISIDSTKTWLADLLHIKAKEVTIEGIQNAVAQEFEILKADILSTSRAQKIARPRQVAMYLAKKLTSKSLYEIGKLFGGKDHATVIHANKKIEQLMVTDEALVEKIANLTKKLK